MARVFDAMSIPVVSAETFIESEFEEKYIYYAQKFGYAGKELELKRTLGEQFFFEQEKINPVVSRRFVPKQTPDEDEVGGEATAAAGAAAAPGKGKGGPKGQQHLTPKKQGEKLEEVVTRLKDVDLERYKSKLQAAEREYATYLKNKQELCNDLMLHLDKPLRAAVTQHERYMHAKLQDDVVRLWDIVVECASGKGAHSVYVLMMRFLNLRMTNATATEYVEYTKKYNDVVADMIRIGGGADYLLESLFNAKYIEGLNTEMFTDQIKKIMGAPIWPQYRDLQSELTRYVNATKGIANALLRKDNPDGIQANAGKITFKGTCFNCGANPANHRAMECPKPKTKCNICGKRGHMDEFCYHNPERKGTVNKDQVQSEDKKAPAYGKAGGARFSRADRKKVIRTISVKRAALSSNDSNNPDDDVLLEYEDDEDELDGEDDEILSSSIRRAVITMTAPEHQQNQQKAPEKETEDKETKSPEKAPQQNEQKATEQDKQTPEKDNQTKDKENKTQEKENNPIKMDCCSLTAKPKLLFAVDSGCVGGGHVVNDGSLLTNPSNAHVTVQGYDGHATVVDTVGTVPGIGRAVLIKNAPNNLLNLSKLCHDIRGSYSGDGDRMRIYDDKGDLFLEAKNHGDGFLSFDYNALNKNAQLTIAAMQFAEHFTPEETARAREAYDLCSKLGHPGFRSLQASLDAGAYGPTHLTSHDVRNARQLFGKCLQCLEAKMKQLKATSSKTPPAKAIGECLYADILPYPGAKQTPTIGGFVGAVFTVDEKSGYVALCGIKSKADVRTAIETIVDGYKAHRHDVHRIVTDDESSFVAHTTALARLGIRLTSTPAGLHNKRAERYIQTFKTRRHAILATLPYQLPGKLDHELALAVVRGMNASCNLASGKRTPHELFTGVKPGLPKHCFGQPGLCYNPNPKPHEPRGQWCIYLGQRDAQHPNNLRVFVPTTGTVCSRLRFEATTSYPSEWGYPQRLPSPTPARTPAAPVILPPPQPGAWNPIQTPALPPDFRPDLPFLAPPHQEGDGLPPRIQPMMPILDGPPSHNQPMLPTLDNVRTQPSDVVTPLKQDPTPPREPPTTSEAPEETPPAQEGDTPPETTKTPMSPVKRSARLNRPDYKTIKYDVYGKTGHKVLARSARQIRELTVYRLSLNKALKEESRLEDTIRAAKKEVHHLYSTLHALQAVKRQEIPREHKEKILNAHIFFKDKYLSDGTYAGRKARLVINGNEQNPWDMQDTRSPTINPISLFLALSGAAQRPHVISAYDVVSAFPTTPMTEGQIIIVRIRQPQLVQLMIDMYPYLEEYVDNGCIFFYLKKFLYGLAEAAKAFYDRVRKQLEVNGYLRSTMDEGLFIRRLNGGKRHIVCIHVDDMLSIAPDDKARQQLERTLEDAFEIKKQQGRVLSYLGMTIRSELDGCITMAQPGFAADLVDKHLQAVRHRELRPTKTPVAMDLLAQDKSQPADKASFVSGIMTCLYLARYTRPDILFATSFLATKAQAPTEKNHQDLQRIIRYVSETRNEGIKFTRADEKLTIFADASHLTHADGKGHTGIVIRHGGNVVMARATKQKIQARSSTEAEIIAAEEAVTFAPFMKQVAAEMAISMEMELAQDNKSAIHLMQQGGQFQRTKHMLSRISYLREMVGEGKIKPIYVPTEDMVADIMTKPLPAKDFVKHKKNMGIYKQSCQK